MTPVPPACALRTQTSMPCARYGRHVQMSEPNTSEPLHSSCTRHASGTDGSDTLLTSPKK